jgi:hypothetical protein
MGLWQRVIGRMRNRGAFADGPYDDIDVSDEPEHRRFHVPTTPTQRPFERPHSTPTTEIPSVGKRTAGTPSYGSQGGTPSTRRLHNPTHWR